MNKINSFADLEIFFKNYFLKNTLTNNYVLAEYYQQLINENKIFYVKTTNNIFLLVEKEEFYQLYFFINNLEETVQFQSNKPITMEIVYRGANKKPLEIIEFWEKNGFKEHLTRDNLSLTFGNLKQFEIHNQTVQLKYADNENEAQLIQTLFENSLDKYTGDLLSMSDVRKYVSNNNIICAYINQQFCGALQFEIKNNIVWLGHIVTSIEYRGNGIANHLVKKYIEDNSLGANTRYQLWVINDNIAAKSLYEKFGFVYTNKSTTSLLKL